MAEALEIHHLTQPSNTAWYRIRQLQPWLGKLLYDLQSVYLDSNLGVTPVDRAELCSGINPNVVNTTCAASAQMTSFLTADLYSF